MSKNILVDAYNLTKILTSIRKYRKRATSIDMLIDVALIGTFVMYLCMKFLYLQFSTSYEAWTFTSNAHNVRT